MKINSINNSYSNQYSGKSRNTNRQSQFQPSFNGSVLDTISKKYNQITSPLSNAVAKVYRKTVNTNAFQWLSKKLSSRDSFKILMIAESAFLSSCYALFDITNKKIDKKQKPSLVLHDVITFGIGTVGALLLDDTISKAVENKAEKFVDKHKDFYSDLGKKSLEQNGNKKLLQLTNKAVETAKITDNNLFNQELKNTSNLAEQHLKLIVGQEDKIKTFQISKDRLSGFLEQLSGLINQFKSSVKTDGGAGLKEAVQKAAGELYQQAAARKEANLTVKGIGMLNKIVIFGLMYRFLASVLGTHFAVKLSSKFANDKNQQQKIK